MRGKNVLTAALLLFVAASVVTLIAKNVGTTADATELDTPRDGVAVTFFHRKERCDSCRKIEAYAHEAVDSQFKQELTEGTVCWNVMDYEEPGCETYVEKYGLITSTVVVARYVDGEEVSAQNLMKVWDLRSDKAAFLKFIADQTSAAMAGDSVDPEPDDTEETDDETEEHVDGDGVGVDISELLGE